MSRTITYSPAYTLVVTYECFNHCTYCNFRIAPGEDLWLSIPKSWEILQSLQGQNICEILIISGEIHPHSPKRKLWLQRIYDLCQLALSLGFLPHTNIGPLSLTEMETLKSVNVSMGLMLEQITPKLLETVHRRAPSKVPQLRLQQLEWTGELKIPFTTGLLLGIGENSNDWWETLGAITQIHQKWGHIQEVILQPHSLGYQQAFSPPSFDYSQLPEIILKARQILPNTVTIQIPPNLILDPSCLLDCLEAGAKDLGGISQKDEVNPSYPHTHSQGLVKLLQSQQWNLVPRLPVYPQYDHWLSFPLKQAVRNWRTQLKRNSLPSVTR